MKNKKMKSERWGKSEVKIKKSPGNIISQGFWH
jgi:hypothetical protein